MLTVAYFILAIAAIGLLASVVNHFYPRVTPQLDLDDSEAGNGRRRP